MMSLVPNALERLQSRGSANDCKLTTKSVNGEAAGHNQSVLRSDRSPKAFVGRNRGVSSQLAILIDRLPLHPTSDPVVFLIAVLVRPLMRAA